MRDYYEILGVQKGSSSKEIKNAYRKLAFKYHPDKNQGNESAERKFKEAAEAYDVLSNDEKRSRYDQFGHAGVKGNGAGHPGFTDLNDIFSNFGDIFENMGGGGGFGDFFNSNSRQRRSRGTDLKLTLPVTLEDIFSGKVKTVRVQKYILCDDCNGNGCAKGHSLNQCSVCNGTGEVRKVQQSFLGQVVNVQPCYNCNGKGKVISNPCKNCNGDGRVRKHSSIEIEIPPGVVTGSYLTKRGAGNAGEMGSPSGNLIVIFDEVEHPLYLRDENDIIIDAFIDYSTAVFGGKIEVPTLSGKIKLKIPKGIKGGQLLRVRNKGLPELNSHRIGDFLVRMNINIPKNINSKAKKIIEELKREIYVEPEFKKFR